MRRFIFIIVVAIITLLVLIFITNPDLLGNIWIWIIGLIGPIIATIKGFFDSIASMFNHTERNNKEEQDHFSETNSTSEVSEKREQIYTEQIAELENKNLTLENRIQSIINGAKDIYAGTTISLLRYFDDDETTLGLLYIEDEFFCYTLEDTYREVKVKEHTRIPAGTYNLKFNEVLTFLTEKYRKTRPWFEYHIEIQNVKNYEGVYIHSGGTHEHTAGCLLISDSLTTNDVQKALTNSRNTFKRFYLKIGGKLKSRENVRIKILDENWFGKNNVT